MAKQKAEQIDINAKDGKWLRLFLHGIVSFLATNAGARGYDNRVIKPIINAFASLFGQFATGPSLHTLSEVMEDSSRVVALIQKMGVPRSWEPYIKEAVEEAVEGLSAAYQANGQLTEADLKRSLAQTGKRSAPKPTNEFGEAFDQLYPEERMRLRQIIEIELPALARREPDKHGNVVKEFDEDFRPHLTSVVALRQLMQFPTPALMVNDLRFRFPKKKEEKPLEGPFAKVRGLFAKADKALRAGSSTTGKMAADMAHRREERRWEKLNKRYPPAARQFTDDEIEKHATDNDITLIKAYEAMVRGLPRARRSGGLSDLVDWFKGDPNNN